MMALGSRFLAGMAWFVEPCKVESDEAENPRMNSPDFFNVNAVDVNIPDRFAKCK